MDRLSRTRDSRRFRSALEAGDLASIKAIPKADLHNHGSLGMRYPALKEILGDHASPPPAEFRGLPGFFAWTAATVRPFARQPRYAQALISATIEAAIEDGVTILETSFDSGIGRAFPSARSFGRLAASLRERYAGDIRVKPEIGFKKDADPSAEVPFLLELIQTGAFESIDLYGPEICPALMERWSPVYRAAGGAGMKLKGHFGEFEGPEGIAQAVSGLGVSAVQHGIGLARSQAALSWARGAGITCNVCPASNIALGAVKSLKAHPIRRLFDSGLKLSLATDDLVAFGSSVSEQFLDLFRAGLFSAEELDLIRVMGLEEGGR
jgi:adenosine deaminase